ncbi:MAG: TIM barrel protein [Bacteroidota bacterium]|nr:TIM barrel protein [Bacteroidota bacterium]MDP4231152.1 TIM barrel protein [Bacteroidota bacterium]MDP4236081.1 TIM barrel protein [Bacteroidota bacterium]
MNLKIYKSLWGVTGSLQEQVSRIAEAGYDGVECAVSEVGDPAEFQAMLREYHLDYIPLIYTEGTDHVVEFRRLVSLASSFRPEKIVAHAGRDLWKFSDQVQFFEKALLIEKEFGIPIAHETHRRRPLFSPMNAVALMQQLPELKVNADLSHWCCVTESMLEDHSNAIQLAASRAIHIHSRVGYENGPQVPDPAAPEWTGHLRIFESWWKVIIDEEKKRGVSDFTVTPEYGPPSYMQTVPFSNAPLADLWEVCFWSAGRFRELFEQYS